jgi:aspartate kinase
MILQNVSAEGLTDFTFTVHRNDYDQALSTLQGIAKNLNAKGVTGSEKIAKVSIVGVGMRSHAGVASRMFASLADENINIQMISTSEIKVSVVIDEKYLELAVRALHSTFDMDKPQTVEE